MNRLTNRDKHNACRALNCKVEEWMSAHYKGDDPYGIVCDDCPFMEIVNALAKWEDVQEQVEELDY